MRLPGQVIILVFSPNRCDCSIIVPEHLANRTSMSQTIRSKAKAKAPAAAKGYLHSGTDAVSRPSIGAAPRFKTKKPPTKYRYDSSLSPALDWDMNPTREVASFLMACIDEAAALPAPHEFPQSRALCGADGTVLIEVVGLRDAVERLRRSQLPFLNWSGKAERLSFDVPTLPLFVHERLSTTAIIETLTAHRRKVPQATMFEMFADPQRPMAEQVRAFEHRDQWVNRMILGDSLVVMNSLLRFEGLGGQAQCIFIDPPYGVKFGSNFQPFVRKRDVAHGDDADMTREPEMVQAYRDTWELGLHSYLTYLRDRLLVARDLLTPSGSVFVQISDDNVHHVREVMDEIFGADHFVALIPFKKTAGQSSELIAGVADYLLWYARDITKIKYRQLYLQKMRGTTGSGEYSWVELSDGTRRRLTKQESDNLDLLPNGSKFLIPDNLTSNRPPGDFPVTYGGKVYRPKKGYWKTGDAGMKRLVAAGRIILQGETLRYVRYFADFPVSPIASFWEDTGARGWGEEKLYVVQTAGKVVERCILMTTDPGDLVVDPTCGSGTSAYVAEQWGRRWITIDTSRVPLALARQRLLTATFAWYRLRDEKSGPSSGFTYSRRQNRKGEEVGGIVPHVTLKSIANSEPPAEEVLVDRPDEDDRITRVPGPFVVEAYLPTPLSVDMAEMPISAIADEPGDHIARMIEVLRKSPILALPGNRRITMKSIRRPARTLSLSAEAMVDGDTGGGTARLDEAIDAAHEANTGGLPFSSQPVAILFGPADGPVSAKAVLDAAKEANTKNYRHLFVIGFQITADGRREIDAGEDALGLPATYVSATMDLQLGDLLKTQRSSQIFAVCGQPDVDVLPLPPVPDGDGTPRWQIKLRGLDVFDPVTMETDHRNGDDVPAWMLDTGWNGMVFHADQVFFPRTSAWEGLRRALKGTHDDSVWAHLPAKSRRRSRPTTTPRSR
jgi:adenine-specific DNA-methyltransferase